MNTKATNTENCGETRFAGDLHHLDSNPLKPWTRDSRKHLKRQIKQITQSVEVFGGSGRTIVAAEKSGRLGFCSQMNPRYCEVTLERWETYAQTNAVFMYRKAPDNTVGDTDE